MAVTERDFRMLLVAFEDAVTWCETLADVSEGLIASARNRQQPDLSTLDEATVKLTQARRLLVAERSEVMRIKERVGVA